VAAGPHETPDELLDAMKRLHRDQQEAYDAKLRELVSRFDPERIQDAIRDRFTALQGLHGEAVLTLLEAFPSAELLDALAVALEAQPELPPERAWEALSLLAGADRLEQHPVLLERFEELQELAADSGAFILELSEQIESDPAAVWMTLQSLEEMEPEVQSSILQELARQQPGVRVIELLQCAARSLNPRLSQSALMALAEIPTEVGLPTSEPRAADGLERAKAAVRNSDQKASLDREIQTTRNTSRVISSLVTTLDSRGVGSILLSAWEDGEPLTAIFLCDVLRGIQDVTGIVGIHGIEVLRLKLLDLPESTIVEQDHTLALGLLAGCMTLNDTESQADMRGWLDRMAGASFEAQPFFDREESPGPDAAAPGEAIGAARLVLDACPWWVDESPLTFELAAERLLGPGANSGLDPERDSGLYRFLFERRIRDRLDLDSRMLLWMAAFWRSAGEVLLARSARLLANGLLDPHSAVPGHPFVVELTTRSLQNAQRELARRRPNLE